MRTKTIFIITLSLVFFQIRAQNKWGFGSQYIQYDHKDLFLNGVNYVPPHNWMMNLEIWDEDQVEKDFAGMQEVGIKCARFFPFWHLTEPVPGKLDEKIMKRIDKVLEIGYKHGISFQLCLFNGWMSGATFLPDWALGNIFKDKDIIKGQVFLARSFAKRYRKNPAVQCFDFGNEMNVLIGQMKLQLTPEEVDKWMQTIYAAFKEGDPDCTVTNGIGTGFDPYFNIEAISKSSDIMSLHSYPMFHGTSRLDPEIGQRTLYSGNFITEWTAIMHKPVLMQENNTRGVGALRIFYVSSWAEGATGYFWWGSHFIEPQYKIVSHALRKEFSNRNAEELRGDKNMGLLTVDNVPNDRGKAYKECTGWIDRLGVDWIDQLPVCYILTPHTTEFYNTMLQYITPFSLAKQAHFDVKICWEDQKIPDDASCVVISGFQLSADGKKTIQDYLAKGGTVYQSYFNDFNPDIVPSGKPDVIIDSLKLFVPLPEGETFNHKVIRIRKAIIRDLTVNKTRTTVLSDAIQGASGQEKAKELFFKTDVGKGTYYYLACNVEESLRDKNKPWATDDSYLFYAMLKPGNNFMIDNKYVEFYNKKRGKEELLVLLNHENSEQELLLFSKDQVSLEDAITGIPVGKQATFCFRLKPAEILFLKVVRN